MPHAFLRSLGFPVLLLALLASSLVAQVNTSTVTLYEDSVYRGKSFTLPIRFMASNTPYTLPSGWGDNVTSLRWNLTPATRLTFFHDKDGKGAQYRISGTSARLGGSSNIGSFHNDKFSSVMWSYENVNRGGNVEAFYDSSFGGRSDFIPLNSYTRGTVHRLWGADNNISSLRWDLEANVQVTFYENRDGSGREYTIMHNRARRAGVSNIGSYYNDKFSSFSWGYVNPSDGWIRFYTDKDRQGYHLTRYFGSPGQWSFQSEGYNDQIDSLEWSLPANRTVICYRDDSSAGSGMALHGVGSRNAIGTHGDEWTSFQLLAGSVDSDLSNRNLPYNEQCHLAANHAAASDDRGFYVGWYQTKDLDWLLDHGVRAMRLQSEYRNGAIYSVAFNWSETVRFKGGRQPERLATVIDDIAAWLQANPKQVLTLQFEIYGRPGTALSDYLHDHSTIKDMIYTHRHGAWPTTNELVAMGKRVLVTSELAYSPRMMAERDFFVANTANGMDKVSLKYLSAPIDRRHRPLFWMNRVEVADLKSRSVDNDATKIRALAARFSQECNFVCLSDTHQGNKGLSAVRSLNGLRALAKLRNGVRAYAHGYGVAGIAGLSDALTVDGDPILGGSIALRFSAPLHGFLVLGVSDRTSVFGPLPTPLPFGNGGMLRVSTDLVLGIGGLSDIPVSIPNDATLLGVDGFFQGVRFGFTTTNAVRTHVGRR